MKLRGLVSKRRLKRLLAATVISAAFGAGALIAAMHIWPFPIERLRAMPASPVVTDSQGRTMLQLVCPDDQWRLPVDIERMSPWLLAATVAVEDERFHDHCGVDAIAVGRAVGQNVLAAEVVSGASTITMQVCKMMDNRPRTMEAKCVEAFRAVQLERLWTKTQILEAYLNMAPYGGNLRGVEAASRAYFGRSCGELSLGEAALLAGLPQSPSRLRPDRHMDKSLERREVVLWRMAKAGMITPAQRTLARAEPVHLRPGVRASNSSHAAWWALARRGGGGKTTIDPRIQGLAERLAVEHCRTLPVGTQVAVVVIDIEQSAVAAMVGASDPRDASCGQVNGALAPRSPGSALKPFIYAAAMEAGRLNADSELHDVPICRAGWSPRNFDRAFRGKVLAADALRESLNIPAILVAESAGLARCAGLMQAAGVKLRSDAVRRGGLALVVGSVETTLLDLTNAYATIGRGGLVGEPRIFDDRPRVLHRAMMPSVCSAIDSILSSRQRRPAGTEQLRSDDVPWFMWKTGTSAARRDAWAVGHNKRFAVGVWVGRFSGAGSSAYVGQLAAEPLLTALFSSSEVVNHVVPPEPPEVIVRRPIPPPVDMAPPPRVTQPTDGEVLISLGGTALVCPRASAGGGLTWFLNGRLLPAAGAGRLRLEPGQYELRCVGFAGGASAVNFTVR